MIDYIEGNLSQEQEKELNEFLAFHPELKAELDLFGATKLAPDTSVVFENKELLKKAVGGRVITMFSWVKYSAAVAAAIMLFVGVRFYQGNTNEGKVAIKQYHYQNTDSQFAFDRNTDTIINLNNNNNSVEENRKPEYADNIKPKSTDNDTIPSSIQNDSKKQRELNPIQQLDFAKVQKIKSKANTDLRLTPVEAIEDETLAMADNVKSTTYKNVTDISLNDNKTVVDWWIDAVALGGEVGSVVEGVKDYDFNPIDAFIGKKSDTQEVVKTKNINILGFNYYSRKK